MINEKLKGVRIILASGSPRRRELLRDLGLVFDVVVKGVAETYPEGMNGKEIALHVAEKKADAFHDLISENEIVITADTIVWCDGKVLDKPADREDAINIIREISGNTHEVITGVCLLSKNRKRKFCSSTRVTFERMDESEIEYYVDNYRPYDKAGAYGIQEWIGLAACSRIEGSYFNVMGLPVEQVYHELQDFIEGKEKQKVT
jgi:septum formation protein